MSLKDLLKEKMLNSLKGKQNDDEIPEWQLTDADKERRMIKILAKSKKYKKQREPLADEKPPPAPKVIETTEE